jgi:hypothetical protein
MMRKSISIIVFILISLITFSSCEKRATKEQAIEQRSKLITWYESEDFKKLVISNLNDDGSVKDQAKLENDIKDAEAKINDKIVKEMGFGSAEEFKATEEVLGSKEVKEMDKKLEESATNAALKIVTEFAAKKNSEETKKLEGTGN